MFLTPDPITCNRLGPALREMSAGRRGGRREIPMPKHPQQAFIRRNLAITLAGKAINRFASRLTGSLAVKALTTNRTHRSCPRGRTEAHRARSAASLTLSALTSLLLPPSHGSNARDAATELPACCPSSRQHRRQVLSRRIQSFALYVLSPVSVASSTLAWLPPLTHSFLANVSVSSASSPSFIVIAQRHQSAIRNRGQCQRSNHQSAKQ